MAAVATGERWRHTSKGDGRRPPRWWQREKKLVGPTGEDTGSLLDCGGRELGQGHCSARVVHRRWGRRRRGGRGGDGVAERRDRRGGRQAQLSAGRDVVDGGCSAEGKKESGFEQGRAVRGRRGRGRAGGTSGSWKRRGWRWQWQEMARGGAIMAAGGTGCSCCCRREGRRWSAGFIVLQRWKEKE